MAEVQAFSNTLSLTEQPEIMVRICRFGTEHPEQRTGVWTMMQSRSDLSSSDDDEGLDADLLKSRACFKICTTQSDAQKAG